MGLKFFKMSGGGNDFIVFDNRGGEIALGAGWVRAVCRRGLGVGADGVIALEKSPKAHFRMRYFNADGGEAAFCGNGIRCAARFAFMKVIAPRDMYIETGGGVRRAAVDGTEVTVEMENPVLEKLHRRVKAEGRVFEGHSVRAGVPHFIHFVEDLENFPVERLGAALRRHPDFGADGTNVSFVKSAGPGRLSLRTFERGVEGETLACGSGSACAAAAAVSLGMTGFPVECLTRGGAVLTISGEVGERGITGLRLKGEARIVYVAELMEQN
jgi:diaminopimelate epimerase